MKLRLAAMHVPCLLKFLRMRDTEERLRNLALKKDERDGFAVYRRVTMAGAWREQNDRPRGSESVVLTDTGPPRDVPLIYRQILFSFNNLIFFFCSSGQTK